MSDISNVKRYKYGKLYKVTEDLCIPVGERGAKGFRGTLTNTARRQSMRATKTPYNLWLENDLMVAARARVAEGYERSINVLINKIVKAYFKNTE